MFVLRRTPRLAARVHAARLGARTATRLVQPARTVRIAPGSRRSLCTPAGRDHVARDAAAAGAAASDDGSDVDEFEDVDAFDEAQWADAALGAEAGDGDGSGAADAETRANAHSEQAAAGGPEPVAEGEGGVAAPSAAQPGAAGGVSRVKPALGADDGVPTEPFVVAISGASGMIGSALTAALSVPSLANRHHPVIAPLVRRTPATPNEIKWLPNDDYIDVSKLEGCEALVNLAGRPLGLRMTLRSKHEVFHSRRRATELLAAAILSLENPPKVVVSASGIGYYGNACGDTVLTEESPQGDGFLADLAEMWEDAIAPVRERGVRVVNARMGVVMSAQAGALAKMLPAFRFGLGGVIGSGDQWMSCISLPDVVRAIMFAIRTPELDGVVNFTAPHPATNRDFTKALGKALKRPTVFPLPAPVARLVFGAEMAQETLLASQRVEPRKLLAAGFRFKHPTVEEILQQAVAASK